MDETGQSLAPPVEPPRGMYPARLDEKGRLKLPAAFQQYFSALPETRLYVTSLDRRIAQIYPIAVWRENEKFFESYSEDPDASQDVWFNANDLGADAAMDGQGRITVNPELRRELELEGGQLHLYSYRGRVQILTEGLYQERKHRASRTAGENVNKLERAGLK